MTVAEAGPGLPAGGNEIGGLPGGGQEVETGDKGGWNFKWVTDGQTLVGVLLQLQPLMLFSAPQNLAEKLQLVPIGHRVGIQLMEQRKSAKPSPFKVFRVVNYGRTR